jgi:hypothetical protein
MNVVFVFVSVARGDQCHNEECHQRDQYVDRSAYEHARCSAYQRHWHCIRCGGPGYPHRGTASTPVQFEQPVSVGRTASTEVGQDELVAALSLPEKPPPLAFWVGGSTEIAGGRGHAACRQPGSLIDWRIRHKA